MVKFKSLIKKGFAKTIKLLEKKFKCRKLNKFSKGIFP